MVDFVQIPPATPGGGGSGDAASTAFDPAGTGLSGTNLQDALVELANRPDQVGPSTAAGISVAGGGNLQTRLNDDDARLDLIEQELVADGADIATLYSRLSNGTASLRGSRVHLLTTKLVDDLHFAAGDALSFKAVGSSLVIFNVIGSSTVGDLIDAIRNGVGANLFAALNTRGQLSIWTTSNADLQTVSSTSNGGLAALFGAVEVAGAVVTLTATATEADIRGKVALGHEISKATTRPVVVRLPAGVIDFAAPWMLDLVDAANLFVVGQDVSATVGTTATSTISSVVGTAANALAVAQYNVTFNNVNGSGFAAGDYVLVDAVLTGAVSQEWPILCGCFVVAAATATTLVVTVPAGKTSTVAALTGLVVDPAAGNGVAFTFRKLTTALRWPANVPGIVARNSYFNISQVVLVGRGATPGATLNGYAATGLGIYGASGIEVGLLGLIGWVYHGASAQQNAMMTCGHYSTAAPGGTRKGVYAAGNNVGLAVNGCGFVDFAAADALCASGSKYEGVAMAAGQFNFPTAPDAIAVGGNGSHGVNVNRSSFSLAFGLTKYRVRGNAATDVICQGGSNLAAIGITSSIPISPALNTVGNNNSIITNG